jgi:hypothetical protein
VFLTFKAAPEKDSQKPLLKERNKGMTAGELQPELLYQPFRLQGKNFVSYPRPREHS